VVDFWDYFVYIYNNINNTMALNGRLAKIFAWTVKKYGIHDVNAKNILEPVILYFSQHDPSSSNKYVALMVRIFFNETKEKEEIIDHIVAFHAVQNKLSEKIFDAYLDEGLNLPDHIIRLPKDIQNYETMHQVDTVTKVATAYQTKRESSNTIVTDETDIVYEDDGYLIVTPLSYEASCYWGVETKWCTTTKDDPQYFKNYTNSGTLFYVIDKYRQDDKFHPMSKFAIHMKKDGHDSQAEIYNRPDHQLGHGLDRVLPPIIANVLHNYHVNGGTLSSVDIFKKFKEFADLLFVLPKLEENWTQIKQPNIVPKGVIIFACDLFPSYRCSIKYVINDNENHSYMVLKWLRGEDPSELIVITPNSFGKVIVSNQSKPLALRELNHRVKRNIVFGEWSSMLNNLLGEPSTYIKVKLALFNDIIMNESSEPLNGWQFTFVRKNESRNRINNSPFSKPTYSVTDLDSYVFSFKGDYEDLNHFNGKATLSFYSNEFQLMPGETDFITWDSHNKDFLLLYYNEKGLKELVKNFKLWVIETITTKSDKIVNDLYSDNALKIMSKSDAFDEYLKFTGTDPYIKQRKTSKASQFFHRNDDGEILQPLVKFPEKDIDTDWKITGRNVRLLPPRPATPQQNVRLIEVDLDGLDDLFDI
jgi:hypothetical protein